MVKVLYLGLFGAIVCAFAALTLAVPIANTVSKNISSVIIGTEREQPRDIMITSNTYDTSVRNERSTNLSHITGSARKIQMYVKNRHLQILPDGTVNGTSDDTSDYTILQRTTVNIGQLKIQGVATCQYLCMDSCGLLYGSKEFLEECIFNEMIEKHHYNTYSSARYSNVRRTLYLALNRRGQPRKVQIRANQQLGKLSTYARVLTKPVNPERVEDLIERLLHRHSATPTTGAAAISSSNHQNETLHPLRHHGGHICATIVTANNNKTSVLDVPGVDRLRCRKRKKRKKKRRRCQDIGGPDGCTHKQQLNEKATPRKHFNKNGHNNNNRKKCKTDSNNKNKCQRLENGELMVNVKKKPTRKLFNEERLRLRNGGGSEKRTFIKTNNKRKRLSKKVSSLSSLSSSSSVLMNEANSTMSSIDDENENVPTMASTTITTSAEYEIATSLSGGGGDVEDSDGDGEADVDVVDVSDQNYDEFTSSTIYYDTSTYSSTNSISPSSSTSSATIRSIRSVDQNLD